MLQRSAVRRSFWKIVGVGAGLLITLLIGSSLIRTAHTAQLKFLQKQSFQQDKAWGPPAPGGAETLALDPGRSIEREISSGQTHAYQIRLDAGNYLRVQVEQRGIDVTVALLSPDGKVVAESRSDNGNFGPETVSFVTEGPIEVRLEVRAPDWEAPSGRYEVKVANLRTATEQDRKRVDAGRRVEGRYKQSGGKFEALSLFIVHCSSLIFHLSLPGPRHSTMNNERCLDDHTPKISRIRLVKGSHSTTSGASIL